MYGYGKMYEKLFVLLGNKCNFVVLNFKFNKSMRQFLLVALCFVAVVGLCGCQQAEEIKSSNEELRMSIEASIGKTKAVASRYAGNTPNEAEFTEGDEIGLSVNGGDFVRWSTADGLIWTQEGDVIHWNNKTELHEFCAFYPYIVNAESTSVLLPDLTKQKGNMEELGTYDFLTASMETDYGDGGIVELEFAHELALMTIKLKDEGDLVSSTINKILITGDNIVTPGTYSFSEARVSLATDDAKGVHSLDVTLNESFPSGGKTYYFVVNSKTTALSEVNLAITYKDKNGKSYTATLEGLGDSAVKFVSGKEYSYNLKVQSGALVMSGNSINDWKSGVEMTDIVINGTPTNN